MNCAGVIKCCGQNWPFYSDGYYGVILGEQQYKTFEILDGHSQQSGVILNQEKLYINGRGKSSTLISLGHAAIKGPDLPFSIQGSDVVGEQKSGSGQVWVMFGDQHFEDVPLRFLGFFKVKFRID